MIHRVLGKSSGRATLLMTFLAFGVAFMILAAVLLVLALAATNGGRLP